MWKSRSFRGAGIKASPNCIAFGTSQERWGWLPSALKLVWDTNPVLTVLLLVCSLGQAAMPVAAAWGAKLVMDSVVAAVTSAEAPWASIIPALVFSGVVAVAWLVVGAAAQGVEDLVREQLTHRLNTLILQKSIALDLEFFEAPQKQDMLQRASAEGGFRPLNVLQSTFGMVQGVAALASTIGMLSRFSIWIPMLLVLTSLPALYTQIGFSRQSFNIAAARTPRARKLMYFVMLLTHTWHVKETKLLGLGPHLCEAYEKASLEFTEENNALALRRNGAAAGLRLLGQAGYYAAYASVIAGVLQGRVTIGDLSMYSGLLMQLPVLAGSLIRTIAGLHESKLFMGNLFAFLAQQPRIIAASGGLLAPASLSAGIAFERVSFRYPGSTEDALCNISFAVNPGEKIAIVGENGAGKTTLIKLLMRLYDPTQGCITLEGNDLRVYDAESVRSRMAAIFQDFERYNLTARENIGFGQLDAMSDLERIYTAARRSGASEVIARLPRGYDSVLGRLFAQPEGGESVELSTGQWQRVALARALIRDAPILVLDEPTASLDAREEYQILLRLRELMADRTVVLISHHFPAVRLADRILVLERGRLVEDGTHQQLLAAGGHYATLFQLQAQGYA